MRWSCRRPGKLDEAATEYRRFLEIAPGSWEARSNLGVVYAGSGGTPTRWRSTGRPSPSGPGPVAVRYNLAVALYKSQRFRDAAGELEAVLKAKPDHPQAPLLLADCRLLLGEWKAVIAILDPVLEKDPTNRAVLYMIGTALMRDRQYERGQRVLDRILGQGDSAEAHLVLALASREANDDIAAEKELRRALELDPRLPTANGLLGEVLVRMGEGSQAMTHLQREIELEPEPLRLPPAPRAPAAAGRPQRRGPRPPREGPRPAAGDPGVRYQSALVEIAKGELEAARETLVGLVAEAPDFSEAHVSLALVYYRLGRREDGNRHQAIVQRLKQEDQARRDAKAERLP